MAPYEYSVSPLQALFGRRVECTIAHSANSFSSKRSACFPTPTEFLSRCSNVVRALCSRSTMRRQQLHLRRVRMRHRHRVRITLLMPIRHPLRRISCHHTTPRLMPLLMPPPRTTVRRVRLRRALRTLDTIRRCSPHTIRRVR